MDNYLLAGVSALSNTKNKLNYPWFFGHSGASVLAGHFLLQENQLSDSVREAIINHLDETISSDTKIFEPISPENPQENVGEFIDSLSDCVKAHSTTGHGVIYGTLALKAITLEPRLFTKEVSGGLVSLMQDCLNDVPNRHYGIDDYHSPRVDYTNIKTFSCIREAVDYSLTVHGTVYPDQTIGKTYYFFAGDLLHSVTYAHALLELEALGYGELVSEGLGSLAKHIFLSSRAHSELEPIAFTQTYDPAEVSFWERSISEPHHIKLAYSSLGLTRIYSSSKRDKVLRDLSKYWATYQ